MKTQIRHARFPEQLNIFDSFEWIGIDIDEGPSLEDLKQVEDDVSGLPDIGGHTDPTFKV
ncbi:MAG: hypothetical protein R3A13_02805 [Bdellovibrionota bacterium]